MSNPLNISEKTITISASYKGDIFTLFYDPNRSRGRVNVSFTLIPGKADEAIWKVKNFHE